MCFDTIYIEELVKIYPNCLPESITLLKMAYLHIKNKLLFFWVISKWIWREIQLYIITISITEIKMLNHWRIFFKVSSWRTALRAFSFNLWTFFLHSLVTDLGVCFSMVIFCSLYIEFWFTHSKRFSMFWSWTQVNILFLFWIFINWIWKNKKVKWFSTLGIYN